MKNPIERNFLLIALGFSALALFLPGLFVWAKPGIRVLLGIIMFGMGITLRPVDFVLVWKNRKAVAFGVVAQYLCMPALAFILAHLFRLDTGLMLGFVLLGACPGGTASNVISYLANGNVALSVSMTLCSTLLSPLLTPAIVYALMGHRLNIPFLPMMLSIVWIVILPIIAGLLVRNGFKKVENTLLNIFPSISILTIAFVIAIVVALNREHLLELHLIVLAVVVLHNVLGLCAGYCAGKLAGCNTRDARTIAIEVGMQNSGLGVALATKFFAVYPLAALPSALFSLWHNVSGISLATVWRRIDRQ